MTTADLNFLYRNRTGSELILNRSLSARARWNCHEALGRYVDIFDADAELSSYRNLSRVRIRSDAQVNFGIFNRIWIFYHGVCPPTTFATTSTGQFLAKKPFFDFFSAFSVHLPFIQCPAGHQDVQLKVACARRP